MLLPFALLLASSAPQACPPTPAALPASLKGWHEAGAAPAIGRAFQVRGADPDTVHGLKPSEVARGGTAALVPFEIDTPATYRIALSDRAWVDVVSGDRVIAASAHAHGPACSGVRKIVDFRLERGRYALHLSGMRTSDVRVLIARA